MFRCPYGQPGDRLYVKESWRSIYRKVNRRHVEGIQYKADGEFLSIEELGVPVLAWTNIHQYRNNWRPPSHMQKWMSRILLEVADVDVMRLWKANDLGILGDLPWELWDSIYRRRDCGWDENPYVWVVKYGKEQGDERVL